MPAITPPDIIGLLPRSFCSLFDRIDSAPSWGTAVPRGPAHLFASVPPAPPSRSLPLFRFLFLFFCKANNAYARRARDKIAPCVAPRFGSSGEREGGRKREREVSDLYSFPSTGQAAEWPSECFATVNQNVCTVSQCIRRELMTRRSRGKIIRRYARSAESVIAEKINPTRMRARARERRDPFDGKTLNEAEDAICPLPLTICERIGNN